MLARARASAEYQLFRLEVCSHRMLVVNALQTTYSLA